MMSYKTLITEQQEYAPELTTAAYFFVVFFILVNQVKKISKYFLWYIMQGVN